MLIARSHKPWSFLWMYVNVSAQIVLTLEQLHNITSKTSDTPNEKAFQETFKDQLQQAIKALKFPDNPEQPQQSWAPFKQVGGV